MTDTAYPASSGLENPSTKGYAFYDRAFIQAEAEKETSDGRHMLVALARAFYRKVEQDGQLERYQGTARAELNATFRIFFNLVIDKDYTHLRQHTVTSFLDAYMTPQWQKVLNALVKMTLRALETQAILRAELTVLESRTSELEATVATVREEIASVVTERALYAEQARTDGLTGLGNRAAYESRLSEIVAEHSDEEFACILIDLDRFKCVNDTHGHQAGDTVLRQVSAIIQRHVRAGDAYRYGGEEFVVLVSAARAQALGEALRDAVETCSFRLADETALQCTVSIGVAMGKGDKMNELVSQADTALYTSKRAGRNRVTTCGSDPSTVQ